MVDRTDHPKASALAVIPAHVLTVLGFMVYTRAGLTSAAARKRRKRSAAA